MHIAIDAHSVGTGLAGNETYAANLVEALAEVDRENRYTVYVTKAEAEARFGGRWGNVELRRTLPHTPLVRIPLTLSMELRRRPVDLLHVQYTAPPFAPCPVVTTIHDLSFEHIPETFNLRSRVQLRLTVRATARRAAHVIAPSEYTRRDLVETYGLDPARVTAIPLAVSPRFRPVREAGEVARVKRRYGIEGEYVLAVGSLQPRKNLARLVRAYSALRRGRGRSNLPQLVLVGKKAWLYGDTLTAIEEEGLGQSVLLTGYVSEDDLPALYTGALLFAYPSFYEGFGLPPLEAMSCGAPVLTGDRTSLPEVVGEAGLTVDPFDTGALAAALARLIDDDALRAGLRERGLQRARSFDWRDTARMTLKVYRRVLNDE
ncbi:MAG: glycosyltransferase family 4 protein [Acidobacteria bacterium]|nr:glycosyltransferase family 4 protein [Acidobacteriota bacterium]